jgi:hypothetical protein
MKIFDLETQGDHKVYELPFMKIHLEHDLCPNVSNLLLTSQWVETEEDCKRIMSHLGQECGAGHLSGISLILLLERVDDVLTGIVQKKLMANESIEPRRFLSSIYQEFMKADIAWREKRGKVDCSIHPDLWEQYPEINTKIANSFLDSIESGSGFAV